MNLDLIESIISEHGVPASIDDVVRIINDRHGVDVRALIQPVPVSDTTRRDRYSIPGFANASAIDRAYREYRSSRRHAACQSYMAQNILSVFKTNSPRGCVYDRQSTLRHYINHLVQRTLPDNVNLEFPAPLVLDQSTRIDLDPQQIGDEDHIRIQIPLTSLNFPPWNDGTSATLPSGLEFTAARGQVDTAALVAAGWQLVHATENGSDRANIVIGAVLPQSVDPNGRHAIVLRTHNRSSSSHINMPVIAEMISVLSARWRSEQPEVEEPSSNIDIAAAEGRELMSIINIVSSVSVRTIQMQNELETARARIPELENSLARDLRAVDELCREIEVRNRDVGSRVMEMARGMFTVVDRVREMRPVSFANVETQDSKVMLSFVTHPFAMQHRNRGIIIPPIRYCVDMMANSYSRGISIYPTTDDRYVHPHMGTNRGVDLDIDKCWGEAGRRPLPEAWARRDWMSLVRLILAFHTQYNRNSPLVSLSTLVLYLPPTNESGWLVPEPTDTSNREMVEA